MTMINKPTWCCWDGARTFSSELQGGQEERFAPFRKGIECSSSSSKVAGIPPVPLICCKSCVCLQSASQKKKKKKKTITLTAEEGENHYLLPLQSASQKNKNKNKKRTARGILYTFKGKRNCCSMHVKGISVHGWWASTAESSRVLSVRLELPATLIVAC